MYNAVQDTPRDTMQDAPGAVWGPYRVRLGAVWGRPRVGVASRFGGHEVAVDTQQHLRGCPATGFLKPPEIRPTREVEGMRKCASGSAE
jgi:hypothetical protein